MSAPLSGPPSPSACPNASDTDSELQSPSGEQLLIYLPPMLLSAHTLPSSRVALWASALHLPSAWLAVAAVATFSAATRSAVATPEPTQLHWCRGQEGAGTLELKRQHRLTQDTRSCPTVSALHA